MKTGESDNFGQKIGSDPLQTIFIAFISGIKDSLKIHKAFIVFLISRTVRKRVIQCFFLNGFIFLGSIFLMDNIIGPILTELLGITGGIDDTLGTSINFIFQRLYEVLWLYPIYCISFILSAIWYQDIADYSFSFFSDTHRIPRHTQGSVFTRWLESMTQEIYRLFLISSFVIQTFLSYLIPYIGTFLFLLHLCWTYSFYSFEYKWILTGMSLEKRINFFESRYVYFAGFGLPSVICTFFFPIFTSYGIFSLIFPVFIIMAITAHPVEHVSANDDSATNLYRHIPIFLFAKKMSDYLIFCLKNYFKLKSKKDKIK